MNEKDLDPMDIAHFKEKESIVRGLGNAAKANIAQGNKSFQPCYFIVKDIIEMAVEEVMDFSQVAGLMNKLLIMPIIYQDLERWLETVKRYEDYFGLFAIPAVEFYINFFKSIEVPKGLEATVKSSPAWKLGPNDVFEIQKAKIMIDSETVKTLKWYQEELQQHIVVAKSISNKISDVRMLQWI